MGCRYTPSVAKPAAPPVDLEGTCRCVCFNFQMTARALTQLYDAGLKPSGIRSAQFALLVGIAKCESTPIGRLAQVLVIWRSDVGPRFRFNLVNRLCFVLHVVIASCVLALGPAALGQDSVDQSPQPQSAAQPERHRHKPVFGNADEFALSGTFEYYAPLAGFNRQNRDIDLQVATIALVAHMQHGWEFQFDGLVLRAHGYRTLPSRAPSPQIPSSAQALGAGPLARWNFLQFNRFRPFVEAGGDFLLFDRPWPTYGTVNNFFLRAGGGVSVRVGNSYWIESTFHWAHISNGECFCQHNPAWNGRGLSLGLRRTFGH
jgi:hypothetical protein